VTRILYVCFNSDVPGVQLISTDLFLSIVREQFFGGSGGPFRKMCMDIIDIFQKDFGY